MINPNLISLYKNSEFAIEIKNALCEINYADYNVISVIKSDSNQEFNEILKNEIVFFQQNPNDIYLILPVVNQYFHNIFDILPFAVKLKKSGQNFKVLLFSPAPDKHVFQVMYEYKLFYFVEILQHLGIQFECVEPNTKYIFANTYVFLQRSSYLERHAKFQTEKEIHPENWILDKSYVVAGYLNKSYSTEFDPIINNYKEIFYDNNKIINKKIYVTRKTANRRKIDEEELENFFYSKGYLIVDLSGMKFLDQIDLFNTSSHVVSLSGSGLTNIIFCHPGTKILEIRNKKDFNPYEFNKIGIITDLEYVITEAFADDSYKILEILKSKKSNLVKQFL